MLAQWARNLGMDNALTAEEMTVVSDLEMVLSELKGSTVEYFHSLTLQQSQATGGSMDFQRTSSKSKTSGKVVCIIT